MQTAMQSVYRRGRIELFKAPANVRDETPVLVTFLEPVTADLRGLGIDELQLQLCVPD